MIGRLCSAAEWLLVAAVAGSAAGAVFLAGQVLASILEGATP